MVALRLEEFETRGLFIVAIEAVSLSVFVHVDAMKLSRLNDVQSALQLFYEM
jgi:hypothetical protein